MHGSTKECLFRENIVFLNELLINKVDLNSSEVYLISSLFLIKYICVFVYILLYNISVQKMISDQ